MKTECNPKQLELDSVSVGRQKLVSAFDGEHISSDGGLMLLHRVDQRFSLIRKFARCFKDLRRPELIEHSEEELVRQRVFGIACGYEDLVDYETLRNAPLLAAVVGKPEPQKQPLANPSTLNHLELTPADATVQARYRKVVYDGRAIEDFFVDAFLEAHPEPLREVVLGAGSRRIPLLPRNSDPGAATVTLC